MTAVPLDSIATRACCELTTVGRHTGRHHNIEIWFAVDGASLYLISGGGDRSDWVRNLHFVRLARVTAGELDVEVRARLPLPAGPERDRAIDLLHDKYAGQVAGTAQDWRRDAYIVALDLDHDDRP